MGKKKWHFCKISFSFLFAVQYVQKYKGSGNLQTCLLDENNYVYSCKNKSTIKSGVFMQWRCIQKGFHNCQARRSTLNDMLKHVAGEHNHAPTFCEKTFFLVDQKFQ